MRVASWGDSLVIGLQGPTLTCGGQVKEGDLKGFYTYFLGKS